MKSSKGRAALCWILAVLSIPVGIVLTSVLYALIPGENTALRLYLFNIPSEIFCFALPAFLILAARPERLARFRATKRGLSVNTVGYTALLAVSATIVVSMIAAIWGEVLNSSFQYTEPAQPRIVPQNAAEWALALLSTALVPALAEEMCFRGMLQGLLTRRLPRAGVWITALVFAAVHLQWSALPALFVLGLALGYVNKRHGFWAGVLLHGLYNAAVLVLSSREIGITLPIVLVCTIAFIFAWRGLMQEEEPHHEADGTGL